MVESGTPSQGGGIRVGRERREGAKPIKDCAVNMTTTSEGELLGSTDLKVRLIVSAMWQMVSLTFIVPSARISLWGSGT